MNDPVSREQAIQEVMDDLETVLYTFQWAYPDMGNNRGELEVDRDEKELVLVVWVPDNDTPEDETAKPLRVSKPVTQQDPQVQIRNLIHEYLCHEADEQMWFNGHRVFYPH